MRKALTLMAVLATAFLGSAACQQNPADVTSVTPTPPIEITLSSLSVAVDQEVYIRARGGNGDYRVSLIAYNYGGYDSLDLSTCLGYLVQSYNGATFLFRPQKTCSSRPEAVQVHVRDTEWNTSEATLVLKY